MRVSILLAAAVSLQAACSSSPDASAIDPLPDCTLNARYGITLTTLDSLSGQPITTRGVVTAQDAGYTENAVSLPPQYFMASERKGTYSISVQVDGFQLWRVTNVLVTADRCHVNTVAVTARLVR